MKHIGLQRSGGWEPPPAASTLKHLIAAIALGVACSSAAWAADVDGKRIIAADQEPGNWMSHGRTYDEQRYAR